MSKKRIWTVKRLKALADKAGYKLELGRVRGQLAARIIRSRLRGRAIAAGGFEAEVKLHKKGPA